MKINNQDVREVYYLIFSNSNWPKWYMRFFKKGFSHVYAIKDSPGNAFWIIVNPMLSHTHVTIFPKTKSGNVNVFLLPGHTLLKVTAKIKQTPRFTACVFNCVEVIKSLIGMRSFFTFTPWQLYKKLVKEAKKWET